MACLWLVLLPGACFAASVPSITTQPQSQSVLAGANAVFTVAATGQGTLTYQWSLNGTSLTNSAHLSGATDTALTISNVVAGDAGNYQVVVSNSHGSVTSSNATLMVLVPPVISAIPDQRTFPNTLSHPIPFTLGNAQSPTISIAAADTTLVPPGDITLTGAGTNWSFTLMPAGSLLGTTTVTVGVTNAGGLGTSRSFQFLVTDFSENAAGLPGAYYGVICWVDYDNDGHLDLFMSGTDTNYLPHTWLFHNNGDGTFTEVATPFANAMYSSADWGDFNNDGYADLALNGQFSPSDPGNAGTVIYRNDGGGHFTQVTNFGAFNPGCVRWGDYDNDGKLDLLVTEANFTSLWHNNGDGTFTGHSTSMLGAGANASAWVDYNNDGLWDIFVSGGANSDYWGSQVYRNQGNSVFTNSGNSIFGFYGGGVVWGDFNNDGTPDLILTGTHNSYPGVAIYRNDGGVLTNVANSLPALRDGAAAAGDFNNDGKLDLFLSGYGSGYTSEIFRGFGNMTFTGTAFAMPGMIHSYAAWGDYDNDGALDLAIMGAVNGGTPATKLYHNDGAMPDTPPTVPGGLNVTLGFNSALLTWNAATDAEQSGGLTYNVRIGTATNGINVLSPLSDLNTGFRRVPKTGNAGYRTSLLITNLTGGTYYWSVQAVDNAFEGSLFAAEQNFTLPAPVITNQPQSLTVSAGSPAMFSVGATGAAPLAYQWQFNGTNILGETNSSLSINPAQFTNQGVYTVTVMNQFGSAASSNVFLTVQTPPTLTQQPQSRTNGVGSWTSFSANATGSTPFAWQWYFNGAPLADGGRIIGAASNVLTVASVLTNDAGLYWLVVSNNFGAATSAVVSLAVTAPGLVINVDFGSGAQSLKTGPAAIGRTAGDFWNFYNVGSSGLTNLLMADGMPSGIGVAVFGAGPVAPANGNPDPMYGRYLYQYGLPGNLTVVTTNLPPGTYDFYYYAGCGDYNYALSVNGVGQGQRQVWGSGSGSTNWQEGVHYAAFRGVILTNSVSTVQVVITYLDSVCLEAVISGMQISETFPGTIAPFFLSQPANQTVVSGFNANFQGGAAGLPAPSYQWLFNGAPLADNGRVAGAATFALAISNAQPADAGNYQLVVSNIAGVVTSAVATLTVQLLPPVFTLQPAGQAAPPGSNAVLSALATGSIPISYQWFANGAALADDGRITGSATATLAISSGQTNDNGAYFVVASNNVNVATSAVVNVFFGVPPVITQPPAGQTNITGTTANFTVLADGTPPFNYQWYFNGTVLADNARISGSTAAGLSISNVQASDAGNYIVTVANPVGSVTSAVATLTVHVSPSVTTQPLGRSTPLGVTNIFAAAGAGDAPLSYQWRLNGADLPGATNTSYFIAATGTNDLGVYNFVVSNAYGFAVSSNTPLTVGPVAGWGRNNGNQCLPPPGLTNVLQIAGGANSSLALNADGTLVTWGFNLKLPANGTNVVMISENANDGALLLRSDGTVVAFGNIPAPPFALSNIVAVAAGYNYGLALRAEGTLVGWDSAVGRTPGTTIPPGLAKITAIAAGINQAMALRSDGTVVAWGPFGSPAGPGASATNVPPGLSNMVAIASGYAHCLALRADGKIVAWGFTSATNVPAGLSNVAAIAAGGYPQGNGQSLAVRTDGTVVGWGDNSFGQTNAPAGLANSVAAACGAYHSLALVNDGKPQILHPPVGGIAWSGRDWTLQVVAAGAAPLAYQWLLNGTNLDGATNPTLPLPAVQATNAGNYQVIVSNSFGVATSLPAPVTVMDSAPFLLTQPATNVSVFLGSKVTLAAAVAGSGPLQLQWRFNNNNIPGATNDTLIFDRVHVANMGAYMFVASNSFGAVTSAVINLTVRQLVAWGDNTFGATNMPANLTNIAAISANFYGNIALRADGTVTIWGDNGYVATNTAAGVSNVVEVGAGYNSYVVLKSNGKPYVWGTGFNPVYSNAIVGQSNIAALEAGYGTSAFLKNDGTVVLVNSIGAIIVNGLTNAVAIEPAFNGFLALRADGTIFSQLNGVIPPTPWTNGLAMAAGEYNAVLLKRDGKVQDYPSAILPAGLSNILGVAVATYANQEFAVRADGTVVTGGIGINTNVPAGLARVSVLDAGYNHCLALLSDRDFPPPFLANALNTAAYVVSSKGSPQWFGETNVTHDGVSAAQSAPVGNNLSSAMRLWVVGPITVNFWWKVSSETNHDFLNFSAGGVVLTNISGEVDWRQCTVSVPSGNQILQWTYAKDAGGSAGQDAGWVDQLQLIPQPPAISAQPAGRNAVGPTNVTLAVAATGTPPLTYLWWKDGGLWQGANTSSLTLSNAVRASSGTYWVVVTNAAGNVTSSNAVLVVRVPELLGAPVLQPNGSIQLSSTDTGGGLLSPSDLTNFEAQASTNLTDWVTLPNALSLTNGTLQLQDTGNSNSPSRFYRLIEH